MSRTHRLPWLSEPTPYIILWSKRGLFWLTHENLANSKKSTLNNWHNVKSVNQNVAFCVFWIQNLTRSKTDSKKSDAFQNVKTSSDALWDYFYKLLSSHCFSGSDGMMLSTVSVNTKLFQRREVQEKVCYRYSHQIYTWRLPHVNSLVNL